MNVKPPNRGLRQLVTVQYSICVQIIVKVKFLPFILLSKKYYRGVPQLGKSSIHSVVLSFFNLGLFLLLEPSGYALWLKLTKKLRLKKLNSALVMKIAKIAPRVKIAITRARTKKMYCTYNVSTERSHRCGAEKNDCRI